MVISSGKTSALESVFTSAGFVEKIVEVYNIHTVDSKEACVIKAGNNKIQLKTRGIGQ